MVSIKDASSLNKIFSLNGTGSLNEAASLDKVFSLNEAGLLD